MAGAATRRKGKGAAASAGSSPPPPSKKQRGNNNGAGTSNEGTDADLVHNQQRHLLATQAGVGSDASQQGLGAEKEFQVTTEGNLTVGTNFPALRSLTNNKAPGDFPQLRSLLDSKMRYFKDKHVDKAGEATEETFNILMGEISAMAQEDCSRLNKNVQASKDLMSNFQEKHQKAIESLEAEATKWREELQKVDGKDVAKNFRKNFTSQIENMKKDVANPTLA